jgi:putative oxidoreductase
MLQGTDAVNRYLPLIGRVLIGLPFVMSGLGKLAAYGPTTEMIAAVGLPLPQLAYLVAVVLELGGGLLLLAGYKVRPVAPFPQERDDGGWPASDHSVRCGGDQL